MLGDRLIADDRELVSSFREGAERMHKRKKHKFAKNLERLCFLADLALTIGGANEHLLPRPMSDQSRPDAVR